MVFETNRDTCRTILMILTIMVLPFSFDAQSTNLKSLLIRLNNCKH